MTYIDSIKDRIRRFRTRNPDELDAEYIRDDPKYAQALVKLKELYDKRNVLLDQVEKLDLDIDACLLLLAMGVKKEEIDARE